MLDHGRGRSFVRDHRGGGAPIRRFPHHRPTDAVLAAGDFVKIDFGRAGLRLPLRHDPAHLCCRQPRKWQLDVLRLGWLQRRRAGSGSPDAGGGRSRMSMPRRGRSSPMAGLCRQLRPRPRPWCRTTDPRSAGNQRVSRRYTACWLCGHRGARRLSARPRRRPPSRTRLVVCDRAPDLLTRFPKETGDRPEKKLGGTTDRGIDRRLQRTGSSCRSTASYGRSTEFPARQARQGPCLRAHQAQECVVGQGRRQDVQRRA